MEDTAMAKKLFIGYDLGDGETITDLAILDDQQIKAGSRVDIISMTMPDNNAAGQAIPTVYGVDKETGRIVFASSILSDPEEVENIRANFKRCPSDLMHITDEERKMMLMKLLETGWPTEEECPEMYTERFMAFAGAVRQFTDAIFTDENFRQVIQSNAVGCSQIVFSVGHPTRWDAFDAAVYKAILDGTVIGRGDFGGVPSALVMAAESRAAFLYVKNNTGMVDIIPKGESALLIDMGSSTIDLTAMTADSRNHQYNSGSNYLGARGIDFLILDWYLEHLRRDADDWQDYLRLIEQNPAMQQAAILSCRKAKEDVYSQSSGKTKIIFADFAPVRVTRDDITALAETKPLCAALSKYMDLPEAEKRQMGEQSWTALFELFLIQCRAEMFGKEIYVTRVILTGSASKMPFAREIVGRVFGSIEVLNDADPSRSISKGLALVGPSNDKSLDFQRELNELVRTDVPEIIHSDIPELASSLSPVIERVIMGIVTERIHQWRKGTITTLREMSDAIQADCSEEALDKTLSDSPEYNAAIQSWLVGVVGRDIALRLKAVCDKYGMAGIELDDLNLLKVNGVKLGGKLIVAPGKEIIEAISTALSLIAGVITAVILPTVLGIVIGIIGVISFDIALALLSLLMLIPGWGWTLLIAIAGIAVFKALRSGMDGAKEQVLEKMQGWNLPQMARNLMSDDRIKKELDKSDLQSKIRASILKGDCTEQIVSSISDKLSLLILKRAEDIKYVLESK